MHTIIIEGDPVPWKAHQGYGRNSYNPRYKEKQFYQWQIRSQWNRKEPIKGPVRVHLSFYFVPPKSTSGIRKRQMLNGVLHHIKRPDTSNYVKFVEDCLKTIIFEDDSQVCYIEAQKLYSEIAKTVIQISEF